MSDNCSVYCVHLQKRYDGVTRWHCGLHKVDMADGMRGPGGTTRCTGPTLVTGVREPAPKADDLEACVVGVVRDAVRQADAPTRLQCAAMTCDLVWLGPLGYAVRVAPGTPVEVAAALDAIETSFPFLRVTSQFVAHRIAFVNFPYPGDVP